MFIFRRDLRVVDNTALAALAARFPRVPILPLFLLNPAQADASINRYCSASALRFMAESLDDLRAGTRGALHILRAPDGDEAAALDQLAAGSSRILAVGFNRDYTPYARVRDEVITRWCAARGIPAVTADDDYTLFRFGGLRPDGSPYKVFTPFYRRCLATLGGVRRPGPCVRARWRQTDGGSSQAQAQAVIDVPSSAAPAPAAAAVRGGRRAALAVLGRISRGEFADYATRRDGFSAPAATTQLGAHMKFGCVSVREVLGAVLLAHGPDHALVRQLLWREFYAHIAHHFPHVLAGQVSSKGGNAAYDARWRPPPPPVPPLHRPLERWCAGATGYPLVDAAMRQLSATGWLHNRLRMVASSFLTRHLGVDWREGERHFARQLVDYDPCSNNGGWQWSAGSGTDAQPRFRILSPAAQAARFDPGAEYIKTWVPELRGVPASEVLAWGERAAPLPGVGYPAPIVPHRARVTQLLLAGAGKG